jgi:membrane protease YdiL (CAAX protease family)
MMERRLPAGVASAQGRRAAAKKGAEYLLPLALAVLLMLALANVSSRLDVRWSSNALALVLASLALAAHLLSERALNRGRSASGVCLGAARSRLCCLLIGVAAAGAGLSAANAVGGCLALPAHWECARLIGPGELTLIGLLAAPVFEEVLLRGYLRRSLLWVGLPEVFIGVVTALLFAYVHVVHWDDASAVLFFSVSLLLSSLAYALDGILLAVVFHAGWNLTAGLVVGTGLSYAAGPLQLLTARSSAQLTVALVMLLLCWVNFRWGRSLARRLIKSGAEAGRSRPQR